MPKKKCTDEEILNTKTNRCVKKSGPTGKKILSDMKKKASSKKDCKDDEIRNPETNRCVKRSGSIGKRVLDNNQSRSKTKRSRSKTKRSRSKTKIVCEKDKILNPKTHKCVKINGQIGKSLYKKMNNVKEFIKELIETKVVNTKRDIKTVLKEREIQFENYDLNQMIHDIFYESLKDVVEELIDSGKVNTLREIKAELKKRNIDYDKDDLKQMVIDIMG